MNNNGWSRRNFIKTTGIAAGAFTAGSSIPFASDTMKLKRSIKIAETSSDFEREPLIRPFGFKGGFMSEIWQNVAWVKSSSGIDKIGLCSQNVLWSDASVFASFSGSGGNSLMYAMTDYALRLLKGRTFDSPVEMQIGEKPKTVYLN